MPKLLFASFTKTVIRGLGKITRTLWRDLARSTTILTAIFFARAFYYCRLRGNLKTMDAENAFAVTVKHNLRMLWKKLNRMNLLISPLSVLEQVDKNSRILVIGPRNEWDLFLLHQAGFEFDRCMGLDLISYSTKVVLGDMHSIPFSDGEFDVVLCGWTISYSAQPWLACDEIARVCKPRGTIGVSVEYFVGDESEERKATGGYVIQDSRLEKRVNSSAQILAMFPRHGKVFFDHDAPLKRTVPPHQLPSNCAVIFQNASGGAAGV